jgi:hypothetical protein
MGSAERPDDVGRQGIDGIPPALGDQQRADVVDKAGAAASPVADGIVAPGVLVLAFGHGPARRRQGDDVGLVRGRELAERGPSQAPLHRRGEAEEGKLIAHVGGHGGRPVGVGGGGEHPAQLPHRRVSQRRHALGLASPRAR